MRRVVQSEISRIRGLLATATSYLNQNYVPNKDFDLWKTAAVQKTKGSFEEVNKKLDLLLLRDASGVEKFNDLDRRISRLEDRRDKR
jgi:hypothetical protein